MNFPDLGKNDIYEFILYARIVQTRYPECATRYRQHEIDFIFEALLIEQNQTKRGILEHRLKSLGINDRLERKKRWSAFYKKQTQSKIASLIKTHPLKAKRLIERLKTEESSKGRTSSSELENL